MSYDPYVAKIKKVLYMQAFVAFFVSGVWIVLADAFAAKSALIGGLIGFVPNVLFSIKIIQAIGKQSRQIEKAFYWGEILKLISTAVLFGLVIIYMEISFLPMLIGFAAVLSVFWFSLLTIK